MKNREIKDALKNANMKQWQLAEMMNISEFTLSRKFRKEMPEEVKKEILKLISAKE